MAGEGRSAEPLITRRCLLRVTALSPPEHPRLHCSDIAPGARIHTHTHTHTHTHAHTETEVKVCVEVSVPGSGQVSVRSLRETRPPAALEISQSVRALQSHQPPFVSPCQ